MLMLETVLGVGCVPVVTIPHNKKLILSHISNLHKRKKLCSSPWRSTSLLQFISQLYFWLSYYANIISGQISSDFSELTCNS